jgi:hypothetical protein
LREEGRLRVFENRVLRRIFGPKRDELTGEWRKLHNDELSDLYSLPNNVRVIKSRKMRLAGHVARMGIGEAYTGFWCANLKARDHVGDPGIRWEDNIKKDLQGVVCWGMDWIELAQDRDRWRAVVTAVMNHWVS